MSWHAVVSAWGSAGDVVPLIALAAALRRRGHDVDFIANPHFARMAVDADLSFRPIGGTADHAALMADDTLFGERRRPWAQIYSEHYLPHVQDYCDAAASAIRHDTMAVIGDEVGATAAAELRGIPHVRVAPSSPRFASRYDPPHPEGVFPPWLSWMARTGTSLALFWRLRNLRRGIVRWPVGRALPPDHPITRFRTDRGLPAVPTRAPLLLCMWPDWFAPPQRDWPPHAINAGFPVYPLPLPPPPVAPGERCPIVATTGTVAGAQNGFFERVVEACRRLDWPAVLVSPHGDHIPRALPPGIRYLAHAPFHELFGRASLVIHHGGIGTSAYALSAGVPQIVVPMRGDQFDNGNRLVRLGVARMLSGERTDARGLARIAGELLQSTRVQARCRYWQERLDPEEGLRRAADSIEALARTRQPPLPALPS